MNPAARSSMLVAASRAQSRQWGFTLVELMVGMTLSLFIAAALGTLVMNMSRAHAELERTSQQIENGRYAIDLLAAELALAGFYGDVAQAGVVYTQPEPCAESLADLGWSTASVNIPLPIEGRTGVGGDAPGCATDHDHLDGTAVLILRRVSTSTTPVASITGADPYLQTSQCVTDPFMPAFIVSNATGDFTLRNLACDTVNPVRRYLSRIYFVAGCSDCTRDQTPTLKRLELIGGKMQETPLAEGIEEIQYEYGFDTNGDGVPDEFLTDVDGAVGSATNDWSNVMAVRIWLLSRSVEQTRGYTDSKTYELGAHGVRGPFNDGYKRRTYTTLVRLTNPAGWRETT